MKRMSLPVGEHSSSRKRILSKSQSGAIQFINPEMEQIIHPPTVQQITTSNFQSSIQGEVPLLLNTSPPKEPVASGQNSTVQDTMDRDFLKKIQPATHTKTFSSSSSAIKLKQNIDGKRHTQLKFYKPQSKRKFAKHLSRADLDLTRKLQEWHPQLWEPILIKFWNAKINEIEEPSVELHQRLKKGGGVFFRMKRAQYFELIEVIELALVLAMGQRDITEKPTFVITFPHLKVLTRDEFTFETLGEHIQMILREGAIFSSYEIGNLLREAFYISTSGEALPPKIALKPVYKLRKLCLANNLEGIQQIDSSLHHEVEKIKLPKFNREVMKSGLQTGHRTTIGEFIPKSESLDPFLTDRGSETLFNSRFQSSAKKVKKHDNPFKTSQSFISEIITNTKGISQGQQVNESLDDEEISFDFISGQPGASTVREKSCLSSKKVLPASNKMEIIFTQRKTTRFTPQKSAKTIVGFSGKSSSRTVHKESPEYTDRSQNPLTILSPYIHCEDRETIQRYEALSQRLKQRRVPTMSRLFPFKTSRKVFPHSPYVQHQEPSENSGEQKSNIASIKTAKDQVKVVPEISHRQNLSKDRSHSIVSDRGFPARRTPSFCQNFYIHNNSNQLLTFRQQLKRRSELIAPSRNQNKINLNPYTSQKSKAEKSTTRDSASPTQPQKKSSLPYQSYGYIRRNQQKRNFHSQRFVSKRAQKKNEFELFKQKLLMK